MHKECILTSVKKTSKAIVLHEDCMIGGFGADIAAMLADECFEYLDAPVKRSASIDTPVPFAYKLEDNFLARVVVRGNDFHIEGEKDEVTVEISLQYTQEFRENIFCYF